MIFKKINNGNELYALFYENSHIRGRYTAFIRGKRITTCSGFLKSIPQHSNFLIITETIGAHGMSAQQT